MCLRIVCLSSFFCLFTVIITLVSVTITQLVCSIFSYFACVIYLILSFDTSRLIWVRIDYTIINLFCMIIRYACYTLLSLLYNIRIINTTFIVIVVSWVELRHLLWCCYSMLMLCRHDYCTVLKFAIVISITIPATLLC